tara:strand:- start:202 stop:426 length:225 start_codon:yes stop_codon:yes gene_type:complete
MMACTPTLQIGSLIRTTIGVYGVVSKYNTEDKMYTIYWAGGIRKGENINYDKKSIEHILAAGEWKSLTSEGERC